MIFLSLVDIGNLEKGFVTSLAVILTLLLVHLGEKLGTLLLEKLAVRVVVFERDAILLHDIIVEELSGGVHGEAPAISHTKSLRHFVNITSEINLPVRDRLHPRFKSLLSEFFYEWFTFISEVDIEDISIFCARHSNLWIFVDVLVDDVVSECNFLESLGSRDNDFSSAKDAAGNLFHIMGWFELDLDSRVSVWFERNFEDVVVLFEPVSHFHEVDVVVETEVGVDHDDPERVDGELYLQTEESLEDVHELSDDALTIEKVTASRHLNASIGKHFDGLGAVRVVVRESDLVVEGRGLQLPLETISVRTLASHLVGSNPLENRPELLYVNLVDKA